MGLKIMGPILAAAGLAFAGAAGAAVCKDTDVKCDSNTKYQKETSSQIKVSGCEALLQQLKTQSISSSVHDTLKKAVDQFEFKEACENHAKCYAGISGMEGKSRTKCDDDFKGAMSTTCESKFTKNEMVGVDVNSVPRSACKASAASFYQAVNQSGCATFTEQRKKFHCAKADTGDDKSSTDKADTRTKAEEKTRDAKDTAKDKMNDAKDTAKDKMDDAKDTAKDKMDDAKDTVKEKSNDAYDKTKEGASDAYDKTKEKTKEGYDKAKDTAKGVRDGLSD